MKIRILVAIDLSPASARIVQVTERIARGLSGEAWVLHVAEAGPKVVRDQVAKEFREEHKQVQQYADQLRDAGIDATALLVRGPIVDTSRQLVDHFERNGVPHEALFWRSGASQTALVGGWKLNVSDPPGRSWLFDLQFDPTEQHDLSAERPEKLAEFTAALPTYQARLDGIIDPETRNVVASHDLIEVGEIIRGQAVQRERQPRPGLRQLEHRGRELDEIADAHVGGDVTQPGTRGAEQANQDMAMIAEECPLAHALFHILWIFAEVYFVFIISSILSVT